MEALPSPDRWVDVPVDGRGPRQPGMSNRTTLVMNEGPAGHPVCVGASFLRKETGRLFRFGIAVIFADRLPQAGPHAAENLHRNRDFLVSA